MRSLGTERCGVRCLAGVKRDEVSASDHGGVRIACVEGDLASGWLPLRSLASSTGGQIRDADRRRDAGECRDRVHSSSCSRKPGFGVEDQARRGGGDIADVGASAGPRGAVVRGDHLELRGTSLRCRAMARILPSPRETAAGSVGQSRFRQAGFDRGLASTSCRRRCWSCCPRIAWAFRCNRRRTTRP